MPARKSGRKAPRRKLSTRFKQNPIQTTKSEFNKLGPVGKTMVFATIAGATSLTATQALNRMPIVGPFMAMFTSWGARLRQPKQ